MLLTAIKVTATVSVYCVPGPVVRVLPFQTPVRSSFTFVCLGLLSTHLHCLFSIINVESRGNFLTVQWLGLRQRSQKEKKKRMYVKNHSLSTHFAEVKCQYTFPVEEITFCVVSKMQELSRSHIFLSYSQ